MTDRYEGALGRLKAPEAGEYLERFKFVPDILAVLLEVTTRVDGALNAAFVNYDPLVNQLSELRQHMAIVLQGRTAAAHDRDAIWSAAVVETLDEGHRARVFERFRQLAQERGS